MAALRRQGPPAQVRRAVADLGVPGERVIASATDVLGEAVGVTTRALYLPNRSGDYDRLPFETISSASWTDPILELVLVGQRGFRRLVRLEQPGEVPPVVRERVMASIAVSEHVDLGGGGGARVTARRVPGEDALSWNVVFDPGLDPADPQLRSRADAAIGQLRASLGL